MDTDISQLEEALNRAVLKMQSRMEQMGDAVDALENKLDELAQQMKNIKSED